MSKKFKGEPCVYCRDRLSEDGDHVVCRMFFPINRRSDLPKVPACKVCNHEKSLLEHYLTVVMPFGAKHADAGEVIQMTPARLAKNRKLHERLAQGLRHVLRSRNGGPWELDLALPFDGAALEKLFEFIVKGLAWHHWRIALGPGHFVRASFLTGECMRRFDAFFAGEARSRIAAELGAGGFVYEAVQSVDHADLTLWRMSLFGVEVGGDPRAPDERCSVVYGVTVPKEWPVAQKLMAMLSTA